MGFGSILKSIGKPLLGLLPGGGTLTSIMDAAGTLSPVLGGAAKNAQNENALNYRNDLYGWGQQEDAALARDKFATTAPNQRISNAARSSILDRYTTPTVNWAGPGSGLKGQIPTRSGGVSGAMANPDPQLKQLLQRVMTDSLNDQVLGGSTGQGKDRYLAPMPKPRNSTMDKILGGLSFGSSILGALGKIPKKQPKPSVGGNMEDMP